MRKAFINTLVQQARQDDSIWLLVADVGFNLVEPFRDEFPDRFINVGIAEQNMIGVAAGLALSGKKVFCYSLGNFPTLRCLEQIRNDICYHNLPVTIVNSGAGLYYGALGSSHHATEDIAIMRALPNMIVLSPCDPIESKQATMFCCTSKQPHYIRLQGSNDNDISYRIESLVVRDMMFLTTGAITNEALIASKLLKRNGIDISVWAEMCIKPFSYDLLFKIINGGCRTIFTVEEHNLSGGLGSAVLEELSALGLNAKVIRLGIQDKFIKEIGSQEYLRKLNGLDAQSIANKVMEVIRG